jgi:hypothetical protein
VTRWPHRLPAAPVEPPAWFRRFVLDDWAEPGDDEQCWPGGVPMAAEEVAYRRWSDACREWAIENDVSIVDWLRERRAARRAARGRRP